MMDSQRSDERWESKRKKERRDRRSGDGERKRWVGGRRKEKKMREGRRTPFLSVRKFTARIFSGLDADQV
jgi:hypothetical protein